MGPEVLREEDHEGREDRVGQEVHEVREGHVDHHEDHHVNHEAHVDQVAYVPFQGEAFLDLVVAFVVHLGLQDVLQDGSLDGHQALQDHLDRLARHAVDAEDWNGSCFVPQTD